MSQTQDFVVSASEAVTGYFVSLLANCLFKKTNLPPQFGLWLLERKGKDRPLWARKRMCLVVNDVIWELDSLDGEGFTC